MASIIQLENGITFLRDDWYIEDVLDIDSSLTEDDCIQVLKLCAQTHDENIGINWDVIKLAIFKIKGV